MAAACDVIYVTIVAMETNFAWLKVQMALVNRMHCVESRRRGRVDPIDPPQGFV